MNKIGDISDPLHRMALENFYKNKIIEYFNKNNPPTLEQLLIHNNIREGSIFTCHKAFYCKGLTRMYGNIKSNSLMAQIHTKFEEYENIRLELSYHPEHLLGSSAWDKLSRRTTLMVFGYIDFIDWENKIINARPYVLADIVFLKPNDNPLLNICSSNYLEIHIDSIDSFQLVTEESYPTLEELTKLEDIPEKDIKKAFAEILYEAYIPKDWVEKNLIYLHHMLKLKVREYQLHLCLKVLQSSIL